MNVAEKAQADKLAPCPFCQSDQLEFERGWLDGSPNQVSIFCQKCHVFFWMDEVIFEKQWNFRKQP